MRIHVSPMHAGAFPLRFNDNTRKHEPTAEHFTVGFRVTSAIPEPSTLVTFGGLFGMGLIGAWWRRRRKAA